MEKSALVIENLNGQVVRAIHWEQSHLVVYVNHATRRIELTNHLADLDTAAFSYTVLGEIERRDLENKPFSLQGRGRLRLANEIESVTPLVQLENDDPEEIKRISKWTAIIHGVLALLLVIGSFMFHTIQPDTPPVVTVFRQEQI